MPNLMVALWNRADHYIFALWFLLLSFFPCLISAVGDWMSAILYRAISSQLRRLSTIGKKLVKQQYLFHMPHNMVNFGLLTAEIHPVV